MSEELEGKNKHETVTENMSYPEHLHLKTNSQSNLTHPDSLTNRDLRHDHAAKGGIDQEGWGRRGRNEGGWRGAEWEWGRERRGRGGRSLWRENWHSGGRERRNNVSNERTVPKVVRLDSTSITTEQWNTLLPRNSHKER